MVALGLALMVLSYNVNNAIIVIDFVVNQDVIAKTLCIQKEEQKGCNGKCHLKKQLRQNQGANKDKAPFQNFERFVLNFNFMQSRQKTYLGLLNGESIRQPNVELAKQCTIAEFYDIETPPPNFI